MPLTPTKGPDDIPDHIHGDFPFFRSWLLAKRESRKDAGKFARCIDNIPPPHPHALAGYETWNEWIEKQAKMPESETCYGVPLGEIFIMSWNLYLGDLAGWARSRAFPAYEDKA